MYSSGLHSIVADNQMSRLKFRAGRFSIDASHDPRGVYATFNATRRWRGEIIDPGLSERTTICIVDDDVPEKLEAYAKRMLSTFIEGESSRVAKVALDTAVRLSCSDTTEESGLLKQAINLWAIVHLLVEGGWNFWVRARWVRPERGPPIDPSCDGKTYNLLVLQLKAAAEEKAAQMSKVVINGIQRDLLMPKYARSFPHFLVAIILLHCIEKSTWLLQRWDQDEFRAGWPLGKEPSHFTSQCDKAMEVLRMVCTHRDILPKVYQKEDGTISSDVSQAMSQFFGRCELRCKYLVS
jgi:hypothetical protein